MKSQFELKDNEIILTLDVETDFEKWLLSEMGSIHDQYGNFQCSDSRLIAKRDNGFGYGHDTEYLGLRITFDDSNYSKDQQILDLQSMNQELEKEIKRLKPKNPRKKKKGSK